MAGSFEVGSITAELLLKDDKFFAGLAKVLSKTKEFAAQVKDEFDKKSEPEVINDKKITQKVSRIRTEVVKLATTVRKGLGTAFRTALRFSVRAPVTALRLVGRAAVRTGRQLKSTFGKVLTGSLTRLRRLMIGLRGALIAVGVGFGAFAAIQRARDIESLRIAFENLSGAAGIAADVFLKELRVATRGTISDLELFRVANNAALLGVIESQESYIELAKAARILGRAVGRDTVDALNDLSIGIGRQSRLILDNLGIVVRVEQANEEYASTLNKTVTALTASERRTAFLNATLEAVRLKTSKLGPDVETLNDVWGRFTAQISNTATVISEAFVGKGPFSAIADFLEDNENRIRSFATLVAGVFKATFTLLQTVVEDFLSAKSVADLGQKLSRALTDTLRIVFRLFINLFKLLFSDFSILSIKLAVALVSSIGTAIIQEITPNFLKIGARLKAEATKLALKFPGVKSLFFGEEFNALTKEQTDVFTDAFFGVGAAARALRVKEAAQDNQVEIEKIVGDTLGNLVVKGQAFVKETKKSLLELGRESQKQGGAVGEGLVKAFEEWEKAVVKAKGVAATQLKDLSNQSAKAAAKIAAISEQFRKTLAPFLAKRIPDLELEIRTIGLEESAKELQKFDIAFEGIRAGLSPEDLTRLELTRKAIAQLLEQRDAAKSLEATAKKIKSFEQEILKLQSTIREVEVGELASKFESLDISLRDALKGLDVGFTQTVLNTFEQGGSAAQAFAAVVSGSMDKAIAKAEEIRVAFRRMAESLALAEVGKVAAELQELDIAIAELGQTDAAKKVLELEREFSKFAEALRNSGIEGTKINRILSVMRDKVDALETGTAFLDLEKAIRTMQERTKEARIEFESIGKTDLENALAAINREYTEMITNAEQATKVLIAQAIATGATKDEVQALRDSLELFRDLSGNLRQTEISTAKQSARALKNEDQVKEISQTLETSLTSGITEAFKKGEGAAKAFANVLEGFLDKSIEDAVKGLVSGLEGALTSLVGSGFGGLLTGILGVGGAILQNIDSKKSSTVDDFDTSINSSEAVRGVVAGPTNVAIAKIGENLKSAMRTTEILLEQILQSIQTGGGGVGGGGSLSGNAALPLSTSSSN